MALIDKLLDVRIGVAKTSVSKSMMVGCPGVGCAAIYHVNIIERFDRSVCCTMNVNPATDFQNVIRRLRKFEKSVKRVASESGCIYETITLSKHTS